MFFYDMKKNISYNIESIYLQVGSDSPRLVPVVPKFSPFPLRKTHTFTTSQDNQVCSTIVTVYKIIHKVRPPVMNYAFPFPRYPTRLSLGKGNVFIKRHTNTCIVRSHAYYSVHQLRGSLLSYIT